MTSRTLVSTHLFEYQSSNSPSTTQGPRRKRIQVQEVKVTNLLDLLFSLTIGRTFVKNQDYSPNTENTLRHQLVKSATIVKNDTIVSTPISPDFISKLNTVRIAFTENTAEFRWTNESIDPVTRQITINEECIFELTQNSMNPAITEICVEISAWIIEYLRYSTSHFNEVHHVKTNPIHELLTLHYALSYINGTVGDYESKMIVILAAKPDCGIEQVIFLMSQSLTIDTTLLQKYRNPSTSPIFITKQQRKSSDGVLSEIEISKIKMFGLRGAPFTIQLDFFSRKATVKQGALLDVQPVEMSWK